jgi:preprotein translocase subunit SecG
MMMFAAWQWWLAFGSMGLLMFVGLLLMVIILLQRGRGGGLAGAFGGAGGQSAFGTRAGDVFTKITAGMAILWVFLAGVSRFALEPYANQEAAAGFQSEAELKAKEEAAREEGSTEGSETENGTAADATDTKSPAKDEDAPMQTEPPENE